MQSIRQQQVHHRLMIRLKCIDLDEYVTHHLNELMLNAFQHEVATNFLSDEFVNALKQYCDV
jgi:hypothetical protein